MFGPESYLFLKKSYVLDRASGAVVLK